MPDPTARKIAFLATEGMGWVWSPGDDSAQFPVWRDADGNITVLQWNPYRSYDDAFALVEAMVAKGWDFTVSHLRDDMDGPWWAQFSRGERCPTCKGHRIDLHDAHSQDVPLTALCEAALAALGYREE